MHVVQGTESLWNSDRPAPSLPNIAALSEKDVIVIGGGLAGLTTAVLLQRAGLRTALLEQHWLGSGESGRTTAHLTEYPDAGYSRIAADFGVDAARKVAASKRAAIRLIETFAEEIPCDFRRVPGFLYVELDDSDVLERELDAAHLAGLTTAHVVSRAPLPYLTAAAIEFPDQAQFHPAKYLRGLAVLFRDAGGIVSEGSHVLSIDDEAGGCRVRTDTWTTYAQHVVSVTDAPITGGGLLDTKLRANRSYAMAIQVPAAQVPDGLFWDNEDPYHYVRSASTDDGPVVIVGGEDHRTGIDGATDAFARLEAYCRERFDVQSVARRWSGQIMEPVDGLPYIGPRQDGSLVYIAAGFAGNGMTFGTVAAQVLTNTIRGLGHPCADVYAPNRMMAARQWAKYAAQNLPAAWTLVSELVPHPRASSLDSLQPGEGRVVNLNGEKVAACRDLEGTLHTVSPSCTHMGCDVAWNSVEQTWDCPCHGSRYSVDGDVIHGPATLSLQPLGAFNVLRGIRVPPQP